MQYLVITNHLNKWIKGGINGYSLFTDELSSLDLEKLIEFSSLRKKKRIEIVQYELIML